MTYINVATSNVVHTDLYMSQTYACTFSDGRENFELGHYNQTLKKKEKKN